MTFKKRPGARAGVYEWTHSFKGTEENTPLVRLLYSPQLAYCNCPNMPDPATGAVGSALCSSPTRHSRVTVTDQFTRTLTRNHCAAFIRAASGLILLLDRSTLASFGTCFMSAINNAFQERGRCLSITAPHRPSATPPPNHIGNIERHSSLNPWTSSLPAFLPLSQTTGCIGALRTSILRRLILT